MEDKELTAVFKNGLSEVYGDNIPNNLTFTQFIKDINRKIKQENIK
ncbi:hypothetical protein Javan249_0017 [Streptococcus phage Javan249]|nr:hypothetical protein [Streptococcus halotolerans]QBX16383.1 hypothetical protein Javan249_0017 [Streptococcus phage Javan249]